MPVRRPNSNGARAFAMTAGMCGLLAMAACSQPLRSSLSLEAEQLEVAAETDARSESLVGRRADGQELADHDHDAIVRGPQRADGESQLGRQPGATKRRLDPSELTDEQIADYLDADLAALGSMSLGRPNAGAMVNAVQMPTSDNWELIDPDRSWATQETVEYLSHAIDRVVAEHGQDHPLWIGHLSRRHGGVLRPHRSHQSGRDVDISYYYLPDMNPGWYQRASSRTLDVVRTWAFIKALVTDTDVEYIFIDRSVQKVLREHALEEGEDPKWLESIFQYRSVHPAPLVRHVWGHATHIHIRFHNPRAQEMARRAHPLLKERKMLKEHGYATRYRAEGEDDLEALAERFGTTVQRIVAANGPRALHMKAGMVYSVPTRGNVRQQLEQECPERRLPPPRKAGSRVHAVAAPEPR